LLTSRSFPSTSGKTSPIRYWQKGKPLIDGVRLPAFAANEAATLALLEGDIDWAGLFVPAVDRVYVAKNPAHYKYWFPLIEGTVLLYANTTRPPFDDVRVRKALSLAIDRQRMVKVASFDYTRPSDATGLSDAFTRWRDPAIAAADWVAYDPPRAERLLDEAGLRRGPDGIRRLPDGKPLDYEINAVDGWTDWMRACQVIAKNFRLIGVQGRVKTYSYGAYYDRLQRGDFDLSISWSFVGPTPYDFYRHLFSAELKKPLGEPTDRNWHRFSVPGADELLATFDRSSNEREQHEVSVRLQALFSEHAPAIPLFPSPAWGEYNDSHFVGFPNAADPYARLSPFYQPENLLVLLRIAPRT
jgi:peptide/nickel transport system substrate-binding protein